MIDHSDYDVGDTVEYLHYKDGLKEVVVVMKSEDISPLADPGRFGFDGKDSNGMRYWAFDTAIVRVVKKQE